MTNEILENNLRKFDYSVFSKVRGSLLTEILNKYDSQNSFKSYSQIMMEEKLSDDELDYAAAAGTPNIDKNFVKNSQQS